MREVFLLDTKELTGDQLKNLEKKGCSAIVGNEKVVAVKDSVFDRIKRHNIYVGKKLRHKRTGIIITINHIHSLYGWVVDDRDSTMLSQELNNINEFEELTDDELAAMAI